MFVNSNITTIILTGGKSSRMGRDKGLMEYEGSRLLDHTIKIASGISSQIIISANSEAYQKAGYDIVFDNFPGIGPIGGIQAGLSITKSDINIVMAVDMPGLVPELFMYLLETGAGHDAVIPASGHSFFEPTAGIYRKNVLATIEKNISEGRYKLSDLLQSIDTFYAEINSKQSFYHPNLFRNLNTPGDVIRSGENR